MYDGPVRGGTRGGQGDFKWSQVANDKHRENYLGHSVNAPVGRWQKNSDIHWYNRDIQTDDQEKAARERAEEIRRLKEAEEDALALALGHAPKKRGHDDDQGTGSNDIPVAGKSDKDDEIERLEREARKRDKALRKEERALKRAEKEVKREEKERRRSRARGIITGKMIGGQGTARTEIEIEIGGGPEIAREIVTTDVDGEIMTTGTTGDENASRGHRL